MKKEWETTEINGKLYAFDMLKPELAFALSLRFTEAFGGIIASFIPALGLDSEKLDIFNIDFSALNLDAIQHSMISACDQADAKKIKMIVDAMLPACMVTDISNVDDKGHRCTYDDFSGNIKTLYRVVFCALRFNFADFFVASPQNTEGLGALGV